MSKTFGLIGYPLAHSFSKKYFEEKFKELSLPHRYEFFEISSVDKFPGLLEQNPELAGLNVTIPYKQSIIPFLDEMDEEAKVIGAVNTIKITRPASPALCHTKGFNTDIFGFRESLKKILPSGKKLERAVIIGTGGSSKAVDYALRKYFDVKGIIFISRRPSSPDHLSYNEIVRHRRIIFSASDIIVNTTPVGMFPKTEFYPSIPYDALHEGQVVFDLIYNPEKTLFLKKAEEKGCIISNGLAMLHAQAEKSWELWNAQ